MSHAHRWYWKMEVDGITQKREKRERKSQLTTETYGTIVFSEWVEEDKSAQETLSIQIGRKKNHER